MCHGFDGPRWTERTFEKRETDGDGDGASPFGDEEPDEDVELLTDGGDENED